MTDTLTEKSACYKCPNDGCEKAYDNVLSLCKHWKRTHKREAEELYGLIHQVKSTPLCKCGCGELTTFLGIERGYCEYIQFHAARVNNNYTQKHVQLKSQKTRKKNIDDGLFKPFVLKTTGEHWMKGLTKDDPKMANVIAVRSTPEFKKKLSERFRQYRLDGTVRTLYGEEHSQWKGGVSPLSALMGSSHQLTKLWKEPIREAADYTCQNCGLKFDKGNHTDLHVHHNKERMSTILQLFAQKHNWNNAIALNPIVDGKMPPQLYKLSREIMAEVVSYHVINKISGQALCYECHNLEHPGLNFKRDRQP